MSAANRMQHSLVLARAPEAVFDYVSTPALWPAWHPSSLHLAPGADHPLPAGARFEEDIHAGGRRAHLSWTVRECERPQRWVAEAQGDNGVSLRLEYALQATADGHTHFTRTLEYRLPNALLRLYNALLGRRRIEAESRLSLQQLQAVMARS